MQFCRCKVNLIAAKLSLCCAGEKAKLTAAILELCQPTPVIFSHLTSEHSAHASDRVQSGCVSYFESFSTFNAQPTAVVGKGCCKWTT